MHPLIRYEWLYGLTECLHIIGFTVAVGSMAIVDLHLAGWGVPTATPASSLGETEPWTTAGLVLATITGLIILSTDAGRYLAHPMMQAKLVVFMLAVLFHYSWHARVARRTVPPQRARIVATASLVLWSAVAFAGIFYAFT
jgi:hypothetical protein